MQNKPQRNAAIEALRFLIIFQICLWHMYWPIIDAGFLGVEFFFILSGVFLYKNATKINSPGVLSYTISKMKKFWFKMIIALIFTHIIFCQKLLAEFQENWLHPILRFVSESLLLQNIGPFEGGLNKPLWFFSVLIYGGALVYAFTKYYTKLSIRIIFPIIIISFLAFTFKNGSQEALENWNVIHFIPLALIRGICEIGFGVIIGYIYFNNSETFKSHIKELNIISIISLILYLAIIISNRHFSQYAFIFIPVIICTALTSDTFFNKILDGNIWSFLGKLSFDIFIIHYPLVAIFRHFLHVEAGIPIWIVAMLYYIVLIPCAFVFDMITVKIQKMFLKKTTL